MPNIQRIELKTPFGRVSGVQSHGVASFRRVPYADAPDGPRRFTPPQSPRQWRGVLDASTRGPIPPQLPSRLDAIMGSYDAQQSEDCLHLDIWTTHRPGDRAPVLVFIHGGAFMTGGGSLPCYDGSVLARENGLVVVNISYRLGLLGFCPVAGPDALNLGLQDQLAALRWIHEAIASFGGDPERITICGQSAGAYSVATHLGAEVTRGLFKRAMMMSTPFGLPLNTVETSKPLTSALLCALGAADSAELRSIPIDSLLERIGKFKMPQSPVPGDITPLFMPVQGDDLLPRDPVSILRTGGHDGCDIMIGTTREEYAAFYYPNPALDQLSEDTILEAFRLDHGEAAGSALAQARAQRVPATPRALLGDLNSEATFVKPSLEVAQAQADLGRNVYSYFFDWQSPNRGMGACHCIDLPFLFGNIDVWQHAPMLEGADLHEVAELSRIFRASVAAFATEGDPNGPTCPVWPRYKPGSNVLHFDRRTTISGYRA